MKAVQKPHLHETAKKTIRGMKKSMTPRISVLYLDGKRRDKTLEAKMKQREDEER